MAAQLRLKGKRAKFSVVHTAASDRAAVARLVKGKQRVDAFLCDRKDLGDRPQNFSLRQKGFRGQTPEFFLKPLLRSGVPT